MGRRKIEIQPITHERNRSVTFLKRKNGLFKKAYELGVLCSVDVAVIIFEERPGHQVKLYEYCSGSVRDIVRRHGKHDGDKDSRGPADFGPGGKIVDEDADEDEEEEEPKVPAKRRASGRLKTAPSAPPPIDEDFPSPPAPPTRIPPPPPPPVRRHEQKRQRVEHSPPPPTPVQTGRGRGHVHQNQNHSRSSSAASVGAAPSSAHPSTPFYDTPPAYNAQFFQQQQQPPPQPFGFGGGGGGSGYQSNRPSYIPMREPPEEMFGFMGGGGGGGSGGGGGAGFEWPVHQQHQQQPQQAPPSARNPAGWLDFLSNNNPAGGRTSWERGGPGPGGTVQDLLGVLEHSKEGPGG